MKVKVKKPSTPQRKERDNLMRSKARHMLTVWSFLVLALISGGVATNAYIGNSKEAKRLYEELIRVDAAGGNVEQALYNLRGFMYGHMNTEIGTPTGVKPPIQLKGTYDRLVEAEKARVASAKEANSNVYNTAQQECEKKFPAGLSGSGRIPCITEYVTSHSQPEEEKSVPAGLYQYDFASPAWSADTAGIGLVVTAVLFLIFIFRWFTYRRVLHHLKMSS